MNEELVKIIVKHLDADIPNLQDYQDYYVDGDVTVESIFKMVSECMTIAIKETIETAKCHSDNTDDTDWDGTLVNTIRLLGI